MLRRLKSLVHVDDARGAGRKQKVAVLSASVQRIEQLEALVSSLTAACKAKDESLSAMAQQLRDGLTDRLSWLDGQQAVQSSLSVNGQTLTMLIEAESGRLMDANASAAHQSRRRRRQPHCMLAIVAHPLPAVLFALPQRVLPRVRLAA